MYKIVKVTMADGSSTFYIKKKFLNMVWIYLKEDIGWYSPDYIKVSFPSKEEAISYLDKQATLGLANTITEIYEEIYKG